MIRIIKPLSYSMFVNSILTRHKPEFVSYKSHELDDPVNRPSARYFLLWPGLVNLMLLLSLKSP